LEKLTSFLTSQSRRLHPNFQLCGCGTTHYSLQDVKDVLLSYIFSILKNDPILPPDIPDEEWDTLLSILNPHFILPTLYRRIGIMPQKFHPPDNILAKIRQAFLVSHVSILKVENQLLDIVTAFNDGNIPFLVLKGPAFAWSIYPDPAMRPSTDIDILVFPDHVIKARKVLTELGYKCVRKKFEKYKNLWDQELFIPRNESDKYRSVEIHWDLHRFLPAKRAEGIKELFERAVKVRSGNLEFKTLNNVDALIHRAINNAFVHFKDMRLIWIYDVKLLAEHLKTPKDWDTLKKRCIAWQARIAVEHSLDLAQIWTGFHLPDDFDDFSTWPRPEKKEITLWNNTINRYKKPTNLFKLIAANPSPLSDKIRFIIHSLFPSSDYMKIYYPPDRNRKIVFSYFHRLLKWLSKYAT